MFNVYRQRPTLLVSLLAGAALTGCTASTQPTGVTVEDPEIDASSLKKPDPLPANYAFFAKIGHKAAAARDDEVAIQFYRRALARDGKMVEAHVGLGQVFAAKEDHRRAAESFRKALAVDPYNKDATLGLAEADLASGDPQDAYDVLTRRGLVLTDAAQLNVLGVSLDLLGRHPDAQDAYKRALSFAPDDSGIRNNLAMSLAFDGRYADADEMFDELELFGAADAPRHNHTLADKLAEKGDAQMADTDLRSHAQLALVTRLGMEDREDVGYRTFAAYTWRSPQFVDSMDFAEALLPEQSLPYSVADKAPTGSDSAGAVVAADVPPDEPFYAEAEDVVAPNVAPDIATGAPDIAASSEDMAADVADLAPPVKVTEAAPKPKKIQTASVGPALPPQPAPVPGVFQIQLGSYRSPDVALKRWTMLEGKAPELLQPLEASVERADLGPARGTFFRLRTVPIDGREAADSLCVKLKGKAIDCLVVSYRPQAGDSNGGDPVVEATPKAVGPKG